MAIEGCDFVAAIRNLKLGGHAARPAWGDGYSLFLGQYHRARTEHAESAPALYLHISERARNPQQGGGLVFSWTPSVEDFLAEDWTIW